MRINIGCGDNSLPGWVNVDEDSGPGVDVVATLPPLPFDDASADEIFGAHFLEHLNYDDAHLFLAECWRVLKPGGRLGLVVPDGKQILRRFAYGVNDAVFITDRWYDTGDLTDICTVFLYGGRNGVNAESVHKWLWDGYTLSRAMAQHGFGELREINRYMDERVIAPAWFQCGVEAVKP